ncbi:hypothetical protein PENTCL1PPCAC_118, partial [Pristionchus entomophagus]
LSSTDRIHLRARCMLVNSVTRSIPFVPVVSSVSPRRSITTGRPISSKRWCAMRRDALIASRWRIATTIIAPPLVPVTAMLFEGVKTRTDGRRWASFSASWRGRSPSAPEKS